MRGLMANPEHLKILKNGSEKWNAWRGRNRDIVPDLTNADLSKTDLKGFNFELADLSNANFEGANLSLSSFNNAKLFNTNLKNSTLSGAHFKESDMVDAKLQGAFIRGAYFNGAYLRKTDLSYTDLWGSCLDSCHLVAANFTGADVRHVSFKKLGECEGIILERCHGSRRFIREAQDNEYLEEIRRNYRIVYLFWSISSDCGRSIGRWILLSLFFSIGFGIIFDYLGTQHFHVKPPLPANLVTMIYYSVVTFTTLGFGDITPKTQIGAWVVMCEVIAGYIMLGGLISIFATKLARRSS
jgi:hypothetical protein